MSPLSVCAIVRPAMGRHLPGSGPGRPSPARHGLAAAVRIGSRRMALLRPLWVSPRHRSTTNHLVAI